MSAKDGFETSLLQHLFNNSAVTGIGDSGGILPSAAAGVFAVALYTTTPSDSASGVEANYTGYTRMTVGRAASGWTISGGNCSNTAAITFPQCTGGSNTIVAFAICKAATTGIDDQLLWGAVSPNLSVSTGVTPEFAVGDLDINLD